MKLVAIVICMSVLSGCCDNGPKVQKRVIPTTSRAISCQESCAREAKQRENETYQQMQIDVQSTHSRLQSEYDAKIPKN